MDDFRSSNRMGVLHFLLCLSLAIVGYCAVNVISSKHFHRHVFGAKSSVGLSDDSKKILDGLKSAVEIFVILERTGEYSGGLERLEKDIRRTLNEYAQYATAHKFTAEIIDVAENQKRYAELCSEFGILPTNSVLLSTNGRVKVLTISELCRAKNRKIVAFNGEAVISSAIGELTGGGDSVAYFLVGHGECELGGVSPARGLSALKSIARQKNCEFRPLNLYGSRSIPEDANLVVIAGARSKLLGFEMEILRDYVNNRNGKIVVALDVNFDSGMRNFFGDYGIFVGENLIPSAAGNSTNFSDDTIVKRFAQHKINEKLIEFCVGIAVGGMCEVKCAPWFVDDGKFEVTELLQTDDGIGIRGDDGQRGPYFIAALSERKKFDQLETIANAGKILVIGNADLISNAKINLLGNRIFWLGVIDYMLRGESTWKFDEINVESCRLALSRGELAKICLRALALPVSFLLLAMIVALQRRR
ncbi:MAG: GldG family protein [Puniceicoccales bacterium]|jgi:hypothetical protein|nr:GldG family protein [Puniceicoccales bacterium]